MNKQLPNSQEFTAPCFSGRCNVVVWGRASHGISHEFPQKDPKGTLFQGKKLRNLHDTSGMKPWCGEFCCDNQISCLQCLLFFWLGTLWDIHPSWRGNNGETYVFSEGFRDQMLIMSPLRLSIHVKNIKKHGIRQILCNCLPQLVPLGKHVLLFIHVLYLIPDVSSWIFRYFVQSVIIYNIS